MNEDIKNDLIKLKEQIDSMTSAHILFWNGKTISSYLLGLIGFCVCRSSQHSDKNKKLFNLYKKATNVTIILNNIIKEIEGMKNE